MSALAAYHPGSPMSPVFPAGLATRALASLERYHVAVLLRRTQRLLEAMDVALEEGDRAEADRLFRNAKAAMAKAERITAIMTADRTLCAA